VLVMYQRGLQQGEPDFAAALGVLLVIGVLIVSYVSRRLIERD
jgi:multiple sugar transport system permease protein